MFPLIDRLSLQPSLRPLSVLVFFLFLIHICKASDAISCPVISLLGIDRRMGGVNLNCDSKGWKAEPEVFWLDAAGKPLLAEPTETVRGPDDLYTVSSRVTVEKRHSNSFTCRVQQINTNQTREAQIYIADDFFDVQSISSTTVGLAVGLVLCLLMNLILGFFVWKFKTKRSHRNETNEGEKKNRSKRNRAEDHCVTEEETERQQLMTPETVQMKDLKKGNAAKIKPEFISLQEQQRREAAEKAQKTLEEELETKKTELKKKQADLQQLHEEKQRKEENLQRLKERLENKNTEVETAEAAIAKQSWLSWSSKKKEEQQQQKMEVENLKKQLETEEMEFAIKITEFDDKQVEVQQLQEEIQRMETNLHSLTETNNVKFERS